MTKAGIPPGHIYDEPETVAHLKAHGKTVLKDGVLMDTAVVEEVMQVLEHLKDAREFQTLHELWELAASRRGLGVVEDDNPNPLPYPTPPKISADVEEKLLDVGLLVPSCATEADSSQVTVDGKVLAVVRNAVTPNSHQPDLVKIEWPERVISTPATELDGVEHEGPEAQRGGGVGRR